MISTRARFALHGLTFLAKSGATEPTPFPKLFDYLRSWSDRLPLSRSYVGKIFQDLSKAGLVRAVPGCRGGYRLARSASEVTALDVVRAVDGLPETDCCFLADGACGVVESCGIVRVLDDAQQAFLRVLRGQTLDAMARKMPWPAARTGKALPSARRR